jgi:hypothetical protein
VTAEYLRDQQRALLTMAATTEAARQAARDRHDWPAEAALAVELRRLWREYAELEQRSVA